MGFWSDPPGHQRVRMVFREDNEDGQFSETGQSLVLGCSIQPRQPSEDYSTGQQSRAPFTVYGPPELGALRSWDAVDLEMVPGSNAWQRATLVGPAQVWPEDPAHVQLSVQIVAG
jgi:hypothetical protein